MNGPWADARRILVMRLDNIGDVVMTSPVLRALKENLPGSSITLMASPGGSKAAPLLPWVDEVLPWRVLWQDLGSRLARGPEREWELINTLREGSYDAAVILRRHTPPATPAPWRASPSGWESPRSGAAVFSRPRYPPHPTNCTR